jgi:hypothetical protein
MTEQTENKTRLQVLQEQIDAEQAIQTKLAQAAADRAAAEALRVKMELEARQRAEHEERERRIEEAHRKMQEAAEQKAASEREEQNRVRELERQAESQQEKIREAARQRAAEQALQEKLFLIEQENARLERELTQASTPRPEEPRPITLQSPEHPLSWIFGVRAENSEEIPQGLTAIEQAAVQREADRAFDAQEAAKQGQALPREPIAVPLVPGDPVKQEAEPKSIEEKSTWKPKRKTQRFVDHSASAELESLLRRELKISPNPQRCDKLSAEWDYADVLRVASLVIEGSRNKPISHDAVFGMIEATLEGTASGPHEV